MSSLACGDDHKPEHKDLLLEDDEEDDWQDVNPTPSLIYGKLTSHPRVSSNVLVPRLWQHPLVFHGIKFRRYVNLVNFLLSGQEKPPLHYCKNDPGNKSHPPIWHVIWHLDGKLITPEEWRVIRLMVVTVAPLTCTASAQGIFPLLPLPSGSRAVRELEVLAPLLSYCARTWKGEKTLVVSSSSGVPPSVVNTSSAGPSSHLVHVSPHHAALTSAVHPHPQPAVLATLSKGVKAKHKQAKGGKDIASNTEPCHELSSSPCPLFLAIVQTDMASTLGPQKKSTPAIAPSTASTSSKIPVNIVQKAMSTWQAKANCHAPLDDDDVAPHSQSTTPPAEDPTVTEPEVVTNPRGSRELKE
ncbi:hypothetical protein V8E53_002621 [Lactarius tabidus]